jgi:hypothetical protein
MHSILWIYTIYSVVIGAIRIIHRHLIDTLPKCGGVIEWVPQPRFGGAVPQNLARTSALTLLR